MMDLQVEGRRFRLEIDPRGPSLRCVALDPADEALAEVFNTGWIRGPARLVAGAQQREGFGYEGRVALVFAEDAPDELSVEADEARVDYLDDHVVLPARVWRELVAKVALAATDGELSEAWPGVRAQAEALAASLEG